MFSNLTEGLPFSLVLAEKPDAARRIAAGLGNSNEIKLEGIGIQDVPHAFDGRHYVVASAAGHLYGLADPQKKRRVYPIFDVEWFPLSSLASRKKFGSRSRGLAIVGSSFGNNISRRIRSIERLINQAERIVHACDYDMEGETIGYNILEFASGKRKMMVPVLRAKFSALTESDIRTSFSALKQYESAMARAGRARHLVDYVWGVNLSRAITEAQRKASQEYLNLTIGRVQGPTLAFVIMRDIENRTHVPIPYWILGANLRKDGIEFEARMETRSISTKDQAEMIYNQVSGAKNANVVSAEERMAEVPPPHPFNLGDLQKESFRIYHFSPSMTLSIAEKLYRCALTSYPRTTSQKLPPSIGYASIISRLTHFKEYSRFSHILREEKRRMFPVQGFKDDPAHPAIYPTGFDPRVSLSESEIKIYDLIAKRFLACFSEDSIQKKEIARFVIVGFNFVADGEAILRKGWREIYPFFGKGDLDLPKLSRGDIVEILSVKLDSKFTGGPYLYSSASLLEKMESEDIGTKATRAETISTLIERGYITESERGRLVSSELGLSIFDALDKHCPQITSTELTRRTEELIERIQDGRRDAEEILLQTTMLNVLETLELIRNSEKEIGFGLIAPGNSIRKRTNSSRRKSNTTVSAKLRIGKCPSCTDGELRIIRSSKTKKRFLGCTSFSKGCHTSAPLPQSGQINPLGKICIQCKWPILSVRFAKRSAWKLCPNLSCPSKEK
jgi:DNA topoisomerase I